MRKGYVGPAMIALMLLGGAAFAEDDLERTVTLMAKIGRSFSPSFSPDGDQAAFVSDISGVPQVWTVPVESGWPAKVTALDDPVGEVHWSPAGDWLAFSLAPGGGMNQQIYLVRPQGGAPRRISAGGKINHYLGHWDHGGKMLAYSSNRRDASGIDAYTYEPANGRSRLRARTGGINFLTDIGPERRRGVVSRMANRGDDNLYLVHFGSRKELLLTPHDPPGEFGGGYFSPDGRTVYLLTNKSRDRSAFGRVRLDEEGDPGEIEVLADRDDAELEELAVSEDGRTAALLWNAAGRSELSFYDLESGTARAGPELRGAVGYGLTFSKDGRLLALAVSGAAAPWDIWVIDSETNRMHKLTHSPHAGVDLSALVKPRLVQFRSHDGLELSGWLYVAPEARSRGPVVLSFHGGPEGQERPYFRADYQALLARGISVFAPNVRGSSGFGKKFVNLDNAALRWNAIKDIKACVEYVVRSGIADPKRIGIMGGSYGGYMVMAGLTEYPELFAAGANLFGVVNFETFFENTEPWMAAISTKEYGDPETQSDMLRALSPIHKIDRVRAPTIVLHGANDTNVPVVEAEQVVENLRERNVPVEYVLFEDEGHGFQKTKNRIESTVAVVRWFEKYLTR